MSRTENAAPRKEQGDQRRADESRAVWFQHSQVPDPRSTETERDQDERAEAARRGEDGCNATGC
uniref:Uncharacterized protein n=1 Tax=mine drainage metagenome TaxID=410659 RepID=E6PXT9_9ZZZZ